MAGWANIISIFCLNSNVKSLISNDRVHGVNSIG